MKNALRLALARLLAVGLRARSRAYPFPPGRALVVAPHADDETLGCGGLIAEKTRRGDPVHVAVISDSAARHPAYGNATATEVAHRRQAETLAAMRELGLPGECGSFFGAPDGQLNRLGLAEARNLQFQLVSLLRSFSPAEVFVPFLGGGSTEHDATVWLVRDALAVAAGPRPVVWEYPVWAWWNPLRLRRQLAHGDENFHFDLGPRQAVKRTALARHASQMKPADAPPLPAVLAAACTGPAEFYFNRPD
jgi:LmbE family N-acetylglucosaminyl deacetylase